MSAWNTAVRGTGRAKSGRWAQQCRRCAVERLESRQLLSGGTLGGSQDPIGHFFDPPGRTTAEATGPVRFGSSEDLQEFLIKDALERYQGLFGQPIQYWWPSYDFYVNGGMAMDSLSRGTNAPPDYSETNTQVAGVDEGDIVETDGQWLYVLSGQELVIVDSWPADELQVASRVKLESYPLAEYLHGDRLTVVSQTGGWWISPLNGAIDAAMRPDGWYEPKIEVTVLDVSDRQSPQIVQSTELEGSLIDSRAIGNHVYLAVRNGFFLPGPEILPGEDGKLPKPPDPPILPPVAIMPKEGETGAVPGSRDGSDAWFWRPVPWPTEGKSYVYETQEQYLARIRGQVLDLALPHYWTRGADGTELASGLLGEATDIYRPLQPEDTNLMSVVVFDMASDEPGPVGTTGVPTQDVSEVYASAGSLYLLETRFSEDQTTTQIWKLDRDATGSQFDLAATGWVPGWVLNQFSADEYQGDLRIATTTGWGAEASSGVYVLRQQGDQLAVIGQVENIAPGEDIYSARFVDELGFLTTFRRIDPLWTIDLSDPADPKIAGELEVPGFSHYMQLLPGRYLLGIGRQADPTTGAWEAPQVSLFDVADPADPQMLDRYNIDVGPWGWSEAFSDHHAVGYYPQYGVLTLSVTSSGQWVEGADGAGEYLPPTTELWVFQIDVPDEAEQAVRKGDIRLLGRIAHDAPIRRSVRIDSLLYSLSADTVSIHEILDPGVEIARLYYGAKLSDLGPIDSDRIGGDDFRQADPWYTFEASRDGQLAVLASSAAGPGVNLTLYDARLRPVAKAASKTGSPRIDLKTTAGAKYYLRVSQLEGATWSQSRYAIQLSNLVCQDGKHWTVAGTDGDDLFHLNAAAGVLVADGVRYPFDPKKVASFTFTGGAGNDAYQFAAGSASITVVDADGTDTLDFSQASGGLNLDLSRADGRLRAIGAGGKRLAIQGRIENVVGTPKADFIKGNTAANRIEGRGGNDRLYGGPGDDLLEGGDDNDRLYGGPGDDLLYGEGGIDRLYGEAGDDLLLGGLAADKLFGGPGKNLLIGGRGEDQLTGSVGENLLVGGRTIYDDHREALVALLAEWKLAWSFSSRVQRLSDGFNHPTVGFLRLTTAAPGATVLDDLARDVLSGDKASDRFLSFPNDRVRGSQDG